MKRTTDERPRGRSETANSRSRRRWRHGGWLAILALVAVGKPARATFQKQTLKVPGRLLWLDHGDLNGDGWTDLVTSFGRGAGPEARRFLAVFFQRPKRGYPATPDLKFAAPRVAAMFAVADAVGDAAAELVYLGPLGAFAQPVSPSAPGKVTALVGRSTLLLGPEEGDLVRWRFVRSIDGKPTLLLPTARGLALYGRPPGDAKWTHKGQVRLDRLHFYDAETDHHRRSPRGGRPGRPYALRITTILPVIDFSDHNADGRSDLVTTFEDRVSVFHQKADGTFPERPSVRRWFRLRTPEELETGDAEVFSQALDINGDRRTDVSLTKLVGGISSLRTETRIYLGAPTGFSRAPAQVFKDPGFAAIVRYVDLDGDGRVEMLHPHANISLGAITKMLLAQRVDLSIRIRPFDRSKGGVFGAPRQELETSFGLDLSVGATLRGTAPLIGHDFDGDGRRDLIMSQGRGDRMVLHRGRRSGGGFEEEGRISLSTPGSHLTHVVPRQTEGSTPQDIVVVYRGQPSRQGVMVVFRSSAP